MTMNENQKLSRNRKRRIKRKFKMKDKKNYYIKS